MQAVNFKTQLMIVFFDAIGHNYVANRLWKENLSIKGDWSYARRTTYNLAILPPLSKTFLFLF